LDNRNWKRVWSFGGVRSAVPTTLPAQALGPADSFDGKVRGAVVVPDALLAPAPVDAARPGATVTVPVSLVVKEGASVSGLQFRAVVKAEGNAPVLTNAASFKASDGLPAPVSLDGLPANEVVAAWSLFLNKLAKPLEGRVAVGSVSFVVPENAQPGDLYTVDVVSADGGPNEVSQYDIQGGTAVVAVQAIAPRADKTVPGFRLNWQGFAGKSYVIESTTDLVNGPWTVEQDNIPGRGRALEYVDRNTAGTTKFYRVRPKR